MKEGPITEYQVIDMNNLGNGVAKTTDGKVVFIPGAIDGETVIAGVIKETKDYAVARLEGVMQESENRIESDCKYFGRCGGCSFRHITYEHELVLKKGYVKNAFLKSGLNPKIEDIRTAKKTEGYRNKVQYPLDENYNIGYFAKHSHRIIDGTVNCPLAPDDFSKIVSFALGEIKRENIRGVKNIYLRRADATGQTMLCFVCKERNIIPKSIVNNCVEKHPSIVQIVENHQPKDDNVILGEKCKILFGKDTIEDRICNMKVRISPTSFYQVNRGGCEILYKTAEELLSPKSGETIGDIYCGNGTIGIFLALHNKDISIRGTEIVSVAVENAKSNARLNGIENAEFICSDAAEPALYGLDTFIVDPPRKGLSSELIGKIKESGVKRFVYVSCNPDTLARDCKMLSDIYKIERVIPVDMFPRTSHVESVVKLIRQ